MQRVGKTVGGIDDQVTIPAFSSNLEWRKAEYYKGEEIVLWSDWHWPSWSWIHHCLVHRESTMVSDDSCCTEVDYKVLGYSHASWSVNGLQFNLVVHVSTKAHHVSHSTITQLAWTMGAKYHDMSCCLLLVGPDHTTGCHGVTKPREELLTNLVF